MTKNVLNAINTARKVFEIESFPGNLFERLMVYNYTDKCKLILFKEDIDKLSGFIGYGIDGFAAICVNYKRPMGHQNFTFAHDNSVYNLSHGSMGIKAIRIVNIDDIPGAKEELKRIRKRFYSWMTDVTYLNYLVSQGVISSDDIKKKNFRRKDLGECELIYSMIMR